ncbi:hypothetical protein [Dokdonia sp.]|uniref:hypothetical protein n=1 Tax=Dokdonia sp. TaxID=2024995 RepID=UPI003263A4FC
MPFKLYYFKTFAFILFSYLFLSCSDDDAEVNQSIVEEYIHVGDLFLTSQGNVDFYGQMNLIEVTGTLNISSALSDPIIDLTPINSLRKVNILSVSGNSQLETFNGLENLREVQNIQIFSNPRLESIDALQLDGNIINGIGISNLPMLENTTTFSNIEEIKVLSIGNLIWTDLFAFSGLKRVTNVFSVGDMNFLESLDGINIEYVESDIKIENNDQLINIDALQSITETGISCELSILLNQNLTNIDGFNSLTSINRIRILDNNSLQNLDGFSNLTAITNELDISRNESLSDFCGLVPVITSDGLVGNFIVENNLFNPTSFQLSQGICTE